MTVPATIGNPPDKATSTTEKRVDWLCNAIVALQRGGYRDDTQKKITGSIGEALANYYTIEQIQDGYQPLDEDLSLIAELTTTPFGRSILTLADSLAFRAIVKYTFSELLSKPTTRSGYGITDAEAKGEYNAITTYIGNHILGLDDVGCMIEMFVAGANTVTIPPESSVSWPARARIDFFQLGAGQTSFVAGSGVSIYSRPGLKMTGQFAAAALYYRGSDTWGLVGSLAV